MKIKIVVVFLVMLFLSGCTTGNLTWTPTAEEWAAMTPEQRNAWSANEMRVRQARSESLQKALNDYSKRQEEIREAQRPIIIPTQSPNLNSSYWQEKRARQEYNQNSGLWRVK